MFIIIIQPAKAGTPIVCYSFDLDEREVLNQTINATINGATHSTGAGQYHVGTGAYYLNGTNNYITYNYNDTFMTLDFWANVTADQYLQSIDDITDGPGYFYSGLMGGGSVGKAYVSFEDSDGRVTANGTNTFNDETFHHHVITLNSSSNEIYYYIDTVLEVTLTGIDLNAMGTGSDPLESGRAHDGSYYFSGSGDWAYIDEVKVYNYTFNQTDVNDSYNNSYGRRCASFLTPDTIDISDPLPENYTEFNTVSLPINFTANATIGNWVATLYINDTINQTITNLPSGTNVQVNFSVPFPSSTGTLINYTINVNDGIEITNTTTHLVYIDNFIPGISTSIPTSGQIFMLENLTGTADFIDNFNLFSYNITIDGETIDNQSNINQQYLLNYQLNENLSNYSVGTHEVRLIIADGHINDLNTYSYDFEIEKTNYTDTFNDTVVSLTEQTITLSINKTTSITGTQATLTWNGTIKTAIKNSYTTYDTYTATFTTPKISSSGDINFTWNYNITGTKNSESGTINETQTIVFAPLNITIRDQETNNLITQNVDIVVNTNESANNYSTSTGNIIVNVTGGQHYIDFSSTGYSQNRYYITPTSSSNDTLFLTAYLLNSTDSVNITFLITTELNAPIEGANVNITRVIDSETVTAINKITDLSGSVTVSLDPTIIYTIYISADGYETRSVTVEPNSDNSPYTIALTSIAGAVVSYHQGISYNFTPRNLTLTNNTLTTFGFNFTSTYWTVNACYFQIKDGSNTIVNNTQGYCDVNSGETTLNTNTSRNSTITLIGIITLNGTNVTYQRLYSVSEGYQGSASLMTALESLTNFGKGGFNSFGRILLAVIIITGLTVWTTKNTDFLGEPERILLFIWALTGLFSFIGWLTLPFLTDTFTSQYMVFILISIITVAANLIKWRITT